MYYWPTLQDLVGTLPRDEAIEFLALLDGTATGEPGSDEDEPAEDSAS